MDKPKSFIFIDASNIHYFLKKDGWKVDWIKFKNHYESALQDPCFYYYEGLISKGCYFDQHPGHRLADFNEAKKRKRLIKYMKAKNKKTIVIAPKDRLSINLEKAANVVINLNDIRGSIKM